MGPGHRDDKIFLQPTTITAERREDEEKKSKLKTYPNVNSPHNHWNHWISEFVSVCARSLIKLRVCVRFFYYYYCFIVLPLSEWANLRFCMRTRWVADNKTANLTHVFRVLCAHRYSLLSSNCLRSHKKCHEYNYYMPEYKTVHTFGQQPLGLVDLCYGVYTIHLASFHVLDDSTKWPSICDYLHQIACPELFGINFVISMAEHVRRNLFAPICPPRVGQMQEQQSNERRNKN